MSKITIDENILLISNDKENPEMYEAASALCIIEHDHSICVDKDGIIDRIYIRIIENDKFLRKWYSKIISKGKRCVYNGRISNRHRERLERLQYHVKDAIYIGVAYNSSDKIIFTNDGDFYEKKIMNYLNVKMNINIFKTNTIKVILS